MAAKLAPPPVRLSGIARMLGISVTSAGRRRVTGEMRIGEEHINRGGRVQGGAIMTLADILGAVGTVRNLPPGYRTSTLESKTNFFAAGEGPLLTGVSIPLHIGRTTMVWQTTVRNADKRRVAIVTQTQIVIPVRTPASPTPPQDAGARRRPAKPAGGARRTAS
ncbi:MAG TPA: PaaI family thioesterase [Burkholderiales bacterium]|nr:PaaI family thioesterase [Burkholderiales bacterium]